MTCQRVTQDKREAGTKGRRRREKERSHAPAIDLADRQIDSSTESRLLVRRREWVLEVGEEPVTKETDRRGGVDRVEQDVALTSRIFFESAI